MRQQNYTYKVYNGKVSIYVDGCLFFCYVQLDFTGCYFFKDDTNIYGLEIYLSHGDTSDTMKVYFKTREAWIAVNKLMMEIL